ncbi:serine/threonine-protein kinase Nek8-like [Onthophagus taurus]|uniref:serine/threonine-protein kinase Nek8-like n=1 Tax=Onthophagus taurus TaxID=166361 RepID=UPI0039BE5C67
MSANTYNVLSQLGKGAFGTVYLCERKHNKLKIVVKEISLTADNEKSQTAKNEVQILRSLNNPNVIKYHDNFIKDNSLCIIMEYASHGNLYELLKNRQQRLSFSEVMKFFCQIVMGLKHIHQKKVVHRDLKPENIFLTGKDGDVVKIGDFGISKLLATHTDKTSTLIGTTNYLAPEICDGLPYDKKSDIWSLGCILYELCELHRYFDGSITDIITSIKSGKRKQIDINTYSLDLQNIIDITVQIPPENRPECVNIMAYPIMAHNITKLCVNLGNLEDEK